MSFFRPMLCLLLAMVAAAGATEKRDLTRLRPVEFAQLPEANAVIDLEHFDRDLLAAAIFHETNKWRVKLGVRPFRHRPELDRAADVQVAFGSLMTSIGHTNLMPGQETAMRRVQSVGLVPGTVAENVALTPLLDSGDETVIGVEGRGDDRKYYDLATGRELQPHTYASFAARVLIQWMNSPHHRANIADSSLKFLGCSARSRREIGGIINLYAVQEFFTDTSY